MPDLSIELPCAPLEDEFMRVVDREGKIPAALEALGPVIGREVVVLDCGGGQRVRQLEDFGASVTAVEMPISDDALVGLIRRLSELPGGGADAVVVFWSGFATPGSTFIDDAARLLRPGGRLLLVHDYGRDDVWQLRPDARADQLAWSQRNGPFLGSGFRIRVIHCWWTFDSQEHAGETLGAAFGEAGAELANGMKRPRLEYNVAVYYRAAPLRESPKASEAESESRLVRSPA
jgi:hypothetical protein